MPENKKIKTLNPLQLLFYYIRIIINDKNIVVVTDLYVHIYSSFTL